MIDLKKQFPMASKSFLDANAQQANSALAPAGRIPTRSMPVAGAGGHPCKPAGAKTGGAIEFHLSGQIRGGKNNYIVTRQGRHVPKKTFTAWRDAAMRQVSSVIMEHPLPTPIFRTPVSAIIVHRAEDRRRRDIPAVLDALFHVLERAGVVADDSLIKQLSYGEIYSKENPGADIVLRVLEN